MTINTTPKEMPTGDGHPTAGYAIDFANFPIEQHRGKAFKTLRAAYALRSNTPHDAAQFLTSIEGQV